MGMFISTVAALSTFYPEANKVNDAENRLAQIKRLIAKVPTIAAYTYRHNRGLRYVYPDNDLSYTGNFLNMLFKMTETKYTPNPALERALDVLFILHADHEQNCGTNAMRAIGSSRVDPYSAMAGAAAALYGPLHGGANEEVLNLFSRNGNSFNPKFPSIVEMFEKSQLKRFILDGEIVALDEQGRHSFALLQNIKTSDAPLRFYVFDLLHIDNADLTKNILKKRRTRLEEESFALPENVQLSPILSGGAHEVLPA